MPVVSDLLRELGGGLLDKGFNAWEQHGKNKMMERAYGQFQSILPAWEQAARVNMENQKRSSLPNYDPNTMPLQPVETPDWSQATDLMQAYAYNPKAVEAWLLSSGLAGGGDLELFKEHMKHQMGIDSNAQKRLMDFGDITQWQKGRDQFAQGGNPLDGYTQGAFNQRQEDFDRGNATASFEYQKQAFENQKAAKNHEVAKNLEYYYATRPEPGPGGDGGKMPAGQATLAYNTGFDAALNFVKKVNPRAASALYTRGNRYDPPKLKDEVTLSTLHSLVPETELQAFEETYSDAWMRGYNAYQGRFEKGSTPTKAGGTGAPVAEQQLDPELVDIAGEAFNEGVPRKELKLKLRKEAGLSNEQAEAYLKAGGYK